MFQLGVWFSRENSQFDMLTHLFKSEWTTHLFETLYIPNYLKQRDTLSPLL
jgi:hypothetical protein